MKPTVFAFGAIVVVILILVALFLFFERWTKHREREWMFLLKQDNNKALASLRITAYERLTIMMERITPTALIMRQGVGIASAAMLQLELIKSIREEFEHNVSLQLYVTQETWDRVRRAKEETTDLIKVAFTRVLPESSGLDLSREIFKMEAAEGNAAIREALFAIRAEMVKNY
jgi:hypothetical protein